MTKFYSIIISVMAISLINCGKDQDESSIETAISDSVEMGITSIGGALDDQSGDSIALQKDNFKILKDLLNPLPKAYASTCLGRAIVRTCTSGIRYNEYENCTIPGTNQILDGSVTLTYSDSVNCDLDSINESVTRTYDYTRTTSWGATIRTFSEDSTDFEGNSYGGGATVTKTASGYELTINGKHKKRTSAFGRSSMDISLRTENALTITGGLSRVNRVVNGGQIVLAHNLAQYKVNLEPVNLQYSSSCCYPTSGTINIVYTGQVSGSGSVTFNGCGEATATRDGEIFELELNSCE